VILNCDHVAILAVDLEVVTKTLPSWLTVHDPETHPGEGTVERYVRPEEDAAPSLLLLQPIQVGPYATAMEKRGPGLHHIGCSTNSIDDAVRHFDRHGLLVHPISLKTCSNKIVWLCRPGVPFLVELYEAAEATQAHHEPMGIRVPASRMREHEVIDLVPSTVVEAGSEDEIELRWGDRVCTIGLGN
jgi:hypothetical protein